MSKNTMKQFILYGIVGVCTTAINYIVYYMALHTQLHYLLANSIAWLIAVIFAFYTNKNIVFKSTQNTKETAPLFLFMRFITLFIENVLLAICISFMQWNPLLSKLFVSIITVLSNYGVCKCKIFKKKEGLQYEQN